VRSGGGGGGGGHGGGSLPASPRLSASAAALAGGGVSGAFSTLALAEEALEAAELAQEVAAVREVEAEAEALDLLQSLGRAAAAGGGGGGGGASSSSALLGGAEGGAEGVGGAPPTGMTAAYEMRLALHGFGDELRSLPMVDGSLQVPPLERLLGRMHRTASSLLWRHLALECGLFDLLQAVKSYFLLGRGNIFHTLLHELRPHMGAPPSPLLDLHAALAVATSGEPNDPHLAALRLAFAPDALATPSGGGGGGGGGAAAIPGPGSGSGSGGAGGKGGSGSAARVYEQWAALTLEMNVGWPLSLLLHEGPRRRYAELFRFLLLVKRVQMELHAAWNAQTQSASMPARQRALLMPLWRLRAHMAFLMDNLQHYLHVDVLEAQWQGLMRTAEQCGDFEELSAAHEQCLSALHAQCFLQAASVNNALHQIFQLCLSLCRMLSYAEAGASNEATYRSQFATVSREFSRQSAFLFAFLSNMSSPQQSPHLAQLLLRLNFNSFFKQQ